MPDWRVYYIDADDQLATFDSDMGSPNDVPPEGFIASIGYDANGRYILQGWDYYYFDEETQQWWGMDATGLAARLRRRIPLTGFCEGWTVSRNRWDKIMSTVAQDPDFPRERVNDS